jgi:hypothetical protein
MINGCCANKMLYCIKSAVNSNLLSGEGSVQVIGDFGAVEESAGQEESPIGSIPKDKKWKNVRKVHRFLGGSR